MIKIVLVTSMISSPGPVVTNKLSYWIIPTAAGTKNIRRLARRKVAPFSTQSIGSNLSRKSKKTKRRPRILPGILYGRTLARKSLIILMTVRNPI
jgi:hypothetical protein